MDIILIPGLWLGGSTWNAVAPALEQAGHATHAVTLPGMESVEADRSDVSWQDILDSVTTAIDATGAEKVYLVGHSMGCGVAGGALDARVDRIAGAAFVGGWPSTSGKPLAKGFPTEGADLPMPDLSEFDEADLRGFDEASLKTFKDNAIPSPASLANDVVTLTDERRYDVPVTAICPEYTAEDLQQWIKDGEANVQELAQYKQVTYVDVPTGHWPQLTKPDELAKAILDAVNAAS